MNNYPRRSSSNPYLTSDLMHFSGKAAIQQRVLPAYRAPFFDLLAGACTGGLSVFAGQPRPEEQIVQAVRLHAAQLYPAVNRHFLRVGSPFYQCWQIGILDWLDSWDPDVLIVEANPRYPSTRRAVSWMHARGKPVLGWGLGASPIRGMFASWRQGARQVFLRSLNGVIAYSKRGGEEYRQVGFPPERVFVASNAAAPQPEHQPPARRDSFAGPPAVLFVGRLQRRKRLDHLLEACANLPNEVRPRLTIVGDGPARLELEALAARIYPQADFAGASYGADLERHFSQADLFVLPGTGGLAVQQAMSFGLPVIVARGDGTQEDLVRPGNGWQIPPDDLAALSSALREALSDAARLRRMGAESYRIVAEEVNLERMVEIFIRALNAC